MRSNHGYKIYSRLFCDANSSLRMLHMKQPELSERHVQHFFCRESFCYVVENALALVALELHCVDNKIS